MSKTIGQLFRERREELGLSQQVLAERLGLSSPQYISNIERGLCGPSMEAIASLSDLLKINPRMVIEIMVENYRKGLTSKLKNAKLK